MKVFGRRGKDKAKNGADGKSRSTPPTARPASTAAAVAPPASPPTRPAVSTPPPASATSAPPPPAGVAHTSAGAGAGAGADGASAKGASPVGGTGTSPPKRAKGAPGRAGHDSADGALTDARGNGRLRAVIEDVTPRVDDGRFAVKRVVGDVVAVECDAFTDGHDRLSCVLLHRQEGADAWQEAPMHALVNDRWAGAFVAAELGRHEYAVEAYVDHFKTWRHDLGRREDEKDIAVHLLDGASMLEAAASRADDDGEKRTLTGAAAVLADESLPVAERRDRALDESLGALALAHASRELATRTAPLPLVVDDALAGFSAWYEFFPRSTVMHGDPGAPLGASVTEEGEPLPHGTFREAIERIPYVAEMGFDIIYLPPIHPIGRTDRKGRNNTLTPDDADVGVPWAIGAEEGGHLDVLPALGTLEDFRAFVEAARGQGIETAMDIAFQCAPDHPWVEAHPSWFRHRPDGSVQFAENPPKKYQDIYPLNFESEDWQGLWDALKEVFLHWLEQGVRVFRVDNPHTKPYPFWEWVIREVKRERPDAIFLAEAFTRPKVMHRLAKLGFTHSYTYFTWRNTREELEEYLFEVSRGPGRDYMRPNFWPNTPDILHETLQHGGLSASALRFVLAATMSSNYGVYGPVLELGYVTAREPGSEEYLDSEKYQLRRWNLDRPESLAPLFAHVNRIRREHPALQDTYNASVHATDNERLLCFSKSTRRSSVRADPEQAALAPSANTDSATSAAGTGATNGGGSRDDETLLIIVNLDPHHPQSGWTALDLGALGVDPESEAGFELFDLLTGETYRWYGPHNYVALDPRRGPAHICTVRAL